MRRGRGRKARMEVEKDGVGELREEDEEYCCKRDSW